MIAGVFRKIQQSGVYELLLYEMLAIMIVRTHDSVFTRVHRRAHVEADPGNLELNHFSRLIDYYVAEFLKV